MSCALSENYQHFMRLEEIEGLRVTLYQANSVSHHTHDCHVCFCPHGKVLGKNNKMLLTFYFVYTTLSNYN